MRVSICFAVWPSSTSANTLPSSYLIMISHAIFLIISECQQQLIAYNYYQMQNEKQSVVNFLTPTKLITASLRNKPKLNLNESQFTHNSNKMKPNTVDEPIRNYNSQFDKINIGFNRSDQEIDLIGGEKSVGNQKYKPAFGNNYGLENTSKTVLKSQDQFRMLAQDKTEVRSDEVGKAAIQLFKVQQTKDKNIEEPLDFHNSIKNSRVNDQGQRDRERQQFLASNVQQGKNYQGYEASTEGLLILMNQLKGVKQVIDSSLVELQTVLDNTSKFLQDIDDQYFRIKQRIMDYTSLMLDVGFTKYRKNMVDWAKYEEIQRNTEIMRQQLHKTILQDDLIIQEMIKMNKGNRIAIGKQAEMQQKIQLYNQIASKVQIAKKQCLTMRPQLKKQKITAFEQALIELSDF